jgi:hypothetical protein
MERQGLRGCLMWRGFAVCPQVGLKAYLLWEQNGRPEGGDFSQQAREMLTEALNSGRSITQIEEEMRGVGFSVYPPVSSYTSLWHC